MITIGFDVHPDHSWYAVMGCIHLFDAWRVRAGRLETGTTKEVEIYTLAAELVQRPWELVTGGYLPSG